MAGDIRTETDGEVSVIRFYFFALEYKNLKTVSNNK